MGHTRRHLDVRRRSRARAERPGRPLNEITEVAELGQGLTHLGEVGANRLLAEAGEATTSVRDVKQHKVDPGCRGRLTGRECLRETEIVELAHGRVAGASHLAVGRLV